MIYQITATCASNIGRIRSNNEDNFFFNGRHMEEINIGINGYAVAKYALDTEKCFAVFDGMGGEQAGEKASFIATKTMKKDFEKLTEYVISPRDFLQHVCLNMNEAVCKEMKSLSYGRMGTTVAILYFLPDEVYSCNLGDSRIYRIRNNTIEQLSVDDSESLHGGSMNRKAPLTQFLGIYPDELRLEPHIVKCSIESGDQYLICSDGLTDMITNNEIYGCIQSHASIRQSVEHLVRQALKNGGRDNITVILIKVN